MQNTNFNADATRATITAAFASANANYVTRAKNPQVDPASGYQNDIYLGLKCALAYTDGQLQAIDDKLGFSWAQFNDALSKCSNVKVALRLTQFLGFLVSGDTKYLAGSAKTAMLVFSGAMCSAQNRKGLFSAVTGKGDEHMSDNLRGYEQAKKLLRAVGAVDTGSASTQISVSVSDGGILPALGALTMTGGAPTINPENKIAQTLVQMITGLRDGQLDDIAEKLRTKKRASK